MVPQAEIVCAGSAVAQACDNISEYLRVVVHSSLHLASKMPLSGHVRHVISVQVYDICFDSSSIERYVHDSDFSDPLAQRSTKPANERTL